MYKIKPQDGEWIEIPSATQITGLVQQADGLKAWAAISAIKQALKNVYEVLKSDKVGLLSICRAIKRATFAYKDISKEALDIGSQVHNLIELHVKAKIRGSQFNPADGLNKQVKNGFDAFLEWEKENVIRWIESEQPVYHPTLLIGGTLDAVAELKDRGVYVIDFKASKGFYDGYDLQVAIYRACREHFKQETYFDVQRRDEGDYRIHIKPLKADGMGVLRLDKKTGRPEWKDYSKVYKRCIEAVKGLLIFFYAYKKRRLKNNKRVGGD